MNFNSLIKPAMALGILWAIYKYGPNNAIKGAALGVAGTVVAKQIPVVKDVI